MLQTDATGRTPAPESPLVVPALPDRAAPPSRQREITVLVPAYNEAASLADTLRSLQAQTCPPAAILVIDDASTDGTAEVAAACGVRAVRPPSNTGSKAGAQNFGLQFVATPFVIAVDADTMLDPDAIERLSRAFDDPDVAAACGFVVPRRVQTVWERGRYVEYLFAFTFYKPVQDFYRTPLISSGCFSMYQTEVLRRLGGWPARTLAEDMDLTWSLYQLGFSVRFLPDAVCHPLEPHNALFMRKQLKRWSHGFIQNVLLHWRGLGAVPYLRSAVAVGLWDAAIASIVYFVGLPIAAIVLRAPWLILGYVIDAPAILVPVLVGAARRREIGRALASFPAFFVLRCANAACFVEALWSELVRHRHLTVYEKGH